MVLKARIAHEIAKLCTSKMKFKSVHALGQESMGTFRKCNSDRSCLILTVEACKIDVFFLQGCNIYCASFSFMGHENQQTIEHVR